MVSLSDPVTLQPVETTKTSPALFAKKPQRFGDNLFVKVKTVDVPSRTILLKKDDVSLMQFTKKEADKNTVVKFYLNSGQWLEYTVSDWSSVSW